MLEEELWYVFLPGSKWISLTHQREIKNRTLLRIVSHKSIRTDLQKWLMPQVRIAHELFHKTIKNIT